MNSGANGLADREPSLVRLYMELTGTSELWARGVFMHVCCREGENTDLADANNTEIPAPEKVSRRSPSRSVIETKWLSRGLEVPAAG